MLQSPVDDNLVVFTGKYYSHSEIRNELVSKILDDNNISIYRNSWNKLGD